MSLPLEPRPSWPRPRPPAPRSVPRAGRRSRRRSTFQASWVNDAEFTGYFVAIDQGYYAAEGLELDLLCRAAPT